MTPNQKRDEIFRKFSDLPAPSLRTADQMRQAGHCCGWLDAHYQESNSAMLRLRPKDTPAGDPWWVGYYEGVDAYNTEFHPEPTRDLAGCGYYGLLALLACGLFWCGLAVLFYKVTH